MNRWGHRVIRLLLALNLLVWPSLEAVGNTSVGISVGYHHENTDKPLFLNEAIVAPLFSPLRPLLSHVKANVSVWLAYGLPHFQHFFSYLPALGGVPGLLMAKSHLGISFAGVVNLSMLSDRQKKMMANVAVNVWSRQTDPWEVARELVESYFSSPKMLSARTQLDNEKFRDWLHSTEDKGVAKIAAMLDIQLVAMRYPIEIQSSQAALDSLKVLKVSDELLTVATKSNDWISVAGAIDTLKDLHSEEELTEFNQGRLQELLNAYQSPTDSGQRDISVLPLLARREGDRKAEWVDNILALQQAQKRFQLSDSESARAALELLAGIPVAPESLKQLILQLAAVTPDPNDRDFQAMIRMLAILHYMERSLPESDAARIQLVEREITRTHWRDPDFELPESLDMGDLARRVGEMVHREMNDPAISAFMGELYKMGFLQSMGDIPTDGRIHDSLENEDYLHVAQAAGGVIEDPRIAAETQFSAVAHVVARLGEHALSWPAIYKYSAQRFKTPISLSELGRRVIMHCSGLTRQEARYTGVLNLEMLTSHTRSLKDDWTSGKWAVIIPFSLTPHTQTHEPIFKYITQSRKEERKRSWYIKTFRTVYFPSLVSSSHFGREKYIDLVVSLWPRIKEIVFSQSLTEKIPPYYVEIHPDDRCQNDCIYCHDLRNIPSVLRFLSGEHMVHSIDEILQMNRRAFFRFSGTIGDPLLNSGTLMAMKRLNQSHQRWGITTNGLSINDEVMKELMSAEWVQVSLDAGSNKTYVELKKNKPYVKPAKGVRGPFDQVMDNIKNLVETRKKSGSNVKLIVSVLVQKENYSEIFELSRRLKAMGVDGFQIKMQHYDKRRKMLKRIVNWLFDKILPWVVRRDQDDRYKIMIVQDKETAHAKNSGKELVQIGKQKQAVPVSPINFEHCRIALWNVVLAPTGLVHACCQYFGDTLEEIGDSRLGLSAVWNSLRRQKILAKDPRGICKECSPSDLFMNRFFSFLEECAKVNPGLIDEFEQRLYAWWEMEEAQRSGRRRLDNRIANAA